MSVVNEQSIDHREKMLNYTIDQYRNFLLENGSAKQLEQFDKEVVYLKAQIKHPSNTDVVLGILITIPMMIIFIVGCVTTFKFFFN